MVSVFNSELSGQGVIPGLGQIVLCSLTGHSFTSRLPLSTQVYIGHAGGNPAMD